MARVTQFISYKNQHLLVDSISDLSLLIKILVEDKVFKLEVEHGIKNTKFVDFFAYKLSKIRLKSSLKEYKR